MRILVSALLSAWLAVSALPAAAQTQANTHLATGSSLPATCRVGDVFYKTGTSSGLYACSASNTWGAVSSGSAGTVTNTGTLTSGKFLVGNGSSDLTVGTLTAGVVAAASGTLSAATTLGSGDVVLATALPSCSGGSDKVLYNITSHAFECGTDAGSAGIGAWIKIESQTASSSSSLDFVTGIDSTYDQYRLEIVDVVPGTDNVSLWVRVSHDAGSTWDTASNSYFYGGHDFGNNVASGLYNDASSGRGSTAIPLGINVDNSGASGLIGYTGSFTLWRPSNAARHKFIADGDYLNQINIYVHNIATGRVEATTAIDGIQLLASSGTLLSGTATLYGLTK